MTQVGTFFGLLGPLEGMGTHIRSLQITLLLWALCSSPSFVSAPEASGCPNVDTSSPASPVLESLECRNDYTTHIRCTWIDAPDSLSLFHLDPDDHSVLPCVRGPPLAQNALGEVRVQCRYNTTLFAIGFDNAFFFHTPHSPGLSITMSLAQPGRRHHPHNRTVNITDEKVQNHNWLNSKSSLETLTTGPMTSDFHQTSDHRFTHQLGSGRPTRERADIEMEGSEPGDEDRKVRIKMEKSGRTEEDEMEASGLGVTELEASGWSIQQFKKADRDSLPGPFNLQCVYDGESEVRCSWKMMRELAQIIRYNLHYRTQPDGPSEWCCAGLEDGREADDDDDGEDAVRFSCVFSVFETELLLLDLQPEPRTRVIQSYKHIEPVAPLGLSVGLIGEDWVLNWTLPKYRTVPIASELRYWSKNSPEDVEVLRLPPGISVCLMAERSLLSSTHYLAQVRCGVSVRTGRGVRYAGHPSDWSELVNWTTRPAPASGVPLLYFLWAAIVSITVILTYFTLLAFHRKVKVWEVSLPSPFQSNVLKAVCQAHGARPSSYTVVDVPRMSAVSVVGDVEQLCALDGEDGTVPPAAEITSPCQQASQEECVMTSLTKENHLKEMWHISIPYPTYPPSQHQELTGVLLSDGRFVHLAPNPHNALQPSSEGYQQNPGLSGDTVQDAWLDLCSEDVEMHDGYMDCPKV